ncbi:fatty acid desaturase [Serratia odorifera]|uniref:fatty acid desaturase n=1 Tax=Serratia odorifera TaxID=618 RepID=UPI003D2752C7
MSTPPRQSHYLHPAQRAWIQQLKRQWLWRLELPTWWVMALVYGGWFGVVLCWQTLGPWLGTPLLILLTTGYMSLQHELIHGHPTRWPRLNQLFGLAPLAVWYPYGLYRDTHLQHHRNSHLTDPRHDPESYYFTAAQWQRLPAAVVWLVTIRNTLHGRIFLGPLWDIGSTAFGALKSVAAGDGRALMMWLIHGALLTCLLGWLQRQGVSPLFYLLAVSYPALAITKIRSFYEHRAERAVPARSVINEAGWPWRLLFLNLNYHLVHHDLPGLPWYGLRKVYQAERVAYRQRSQGFVVQGYGRWLADHAVAPVSVAVHPFLAGESTEHQGVVAPSAAIVARGKRAVADFCIEK